MKKRGGILAVLLAAAITITTVTPVGVKAADAMSIGKLQVNSISEVLGVDSAPKFSWQLSSDAYGKGQSAYHLIVALSAEGAAAHNGDVWDSGTVESDKNYDVVYGGTGLTSRTKYYWAVEVWDESGASVGWSEVSTFETGILSQDEWLGEWIGVSNTDMNFDGSNWIWKSNGSSFSGVPEGHQYFRKEIVSDSTKEISSVYVGATADDEYALYVNGEKVGENSGQDAWRNGKLFEITQKFNRGEKNVIAVDAYNSSAGYAGLLAKVEVSYTDGTKDTYVTDETWKVTEEETEGWTTLAFDDSGWAGPDQKVAYGESPWGTGVEPSSENAFAATVLRREFEADQEIKSARAYVAGLGFFEMKINGQLPDDSVLNPANTQYTQTVLYRVFDVTELLQQGENAIGVELGNSFYNETCSVWNWQAAAWRDEPKLRMELLIEYADGTTESITTAADGSWKATKEGPITTNSIYYGETYDARKELTGYDKAGYDDSSWAPAAGMNAPSGELTAQIMEPIRRTKEVGLAQEQIVDLGNGTYVLHVPQMLAGWIKLNIRQPEEGQKVTITYGEKLNEDGTVQKLGGSDGINAGWWPKAYNQQDHYICKGEELETFEPKFSYKGYQYVQIDNYPGTLSAEDVVCYRVSNDMDITGSFESSNALYNQLHQMMMTTMSNNMQGKPTDTPVWEKNGWLGDANVALETMAYNYGYENMLTRFIETMEDCWDEFGNVPNMVPTSGWGNDNSVVWNTIFVFGVDQLWDTYGMESYIAEQYPAMREFILKDIAESSNNGWTWSDGQLSDWVSPMGQGDENADLPYNENPNEGSGIVGTGYVYHALDVMAQLADQLGYTDDAAEYRAAMENIYTAFNAKFYNADEKIYETTTWSNNGSERSYYRQTSNLVPLAFGLVPDEYKEGVLLNLVKDIREKNYHLDTGCIGTKLILPVLSENGYADIAYKILSQTSYPSWGYMANNKGGTSLWEMWENTTRSLGHYFLGTYDEWLYKGVGGIKDMKEGYKTFTVEPMAGGDQTYANVSVDTVRGKVVSNWTLNGDTAVYDITVPVGSAATVILPGNSVEEVQVNAGADGIQDSKAESGKVYLTVGSGSYQFTASAAGNSKADTLELKLVVNEAEKLNQIDYNADAWKVFADVLAEAKTVLNSTDAEQSDVDAMAEKLTAAVEEVKQHINESRKTLKEYLAGVEQPNPIAHPQEYVDAFNKALEAAEAGSNDVEKTNDELDVLLADLQQAQVNLDENKYENYALNAGVDARYSHEDSYWGWGKTFLTDGDRKNEKNGEYTGYCSEPHEGVREYDHEEYVSVDLGETKEVNAVTFYPATQSPDVPNTAYGFPKTFDIQISEDGENWTTAVSETDYPVPSYGPISFVFDNQNAKYVRLYAYNLNPKVTDNNFYYLQLSEMEVYCIPSIANKESLNAVIQEAEAKKASEEFGNVITEVQESFNAALESAKAIAGNPLASQEEVDKAATALLAEIANLNYVKGDIEVLQTSVTAAEGLDLTQYVEAGQEEFQAVLEAAKAVLADPDNATQEKIDEANTNLVTAMENLRYKADKSALNALVEQAGEVDLNKYTDASTAELQKVLAEADDMLKDETLSCDDQTTIDEMTDKLQNALNALKLKEEPGTPDDGNNGGDGNNGNSGSNGTNAGNSTGGNTNTNQGTSNSSGKKTIATGDHSDIILYIVLTALAAAVIGVSGTVIIRKKRR